MRGAGGGGVGCWTGSTGAGDLEDDAAAAAAAAAFELCCIAASAVALDALTPIRPAVGPVTRILPPEGPGAAPFAVSASPLPTSAAAGSAAAVVGVSSRVADPLVPISRPFSSSEKTISSAEKNVTGAGGGLTIIREIWCPKQRGDGKLQVLHRSPRGRRSDQVFGSFRSALAPCGGTRVDVEVSGGEQPRGKKAAALFGPAVGRPVHSHPPNSHDAHLFHADREQIYALFRWVTERSGLSPAAQPMDRLTTNQATRCLLSSTCAVPGTTSCTRVPLVCAQAKCAAMRRLRLVQASSHWHRERAEPTRGWTNAGGAVFCPAARFH